MARQRPSITPGGHFVDLPSTRINESKAAGQFLGVETEYYDTLPDGKLGKLNAPYYRHIMSAKIVSLPHRHGITSIVTTGEEGFCGHDDHIITHLGALDAQNAYYRARGIIVPVLALRNDGAGELQLPVERERKTRSLAYHASQMPLNEYGQITADFWQQHPHYHSLLDHETYDVILPRALGAIASVQPS